MTRKIRWLMCGAAICLSFACGTCGGSIKNNFGWKEWMQTRKVGEWSDAVDILEMILRLRCVVWAEVRRMML